MTLRLQVPGNGIIAPCTGNHAAMGIGISILLLAVGAILRFAVTTTVAGVDLDVVGVVLMVAGVIGLVWALLAAASIGPYRRTAPPP